MEPKKEELEIKKFWKTIFSDWRRILIVIVNLSIVALAAYSIVVSFYPPMFDSSCHYDKMCGGYACMQKERYGSLSYVCSTPRGILPIAALLALASAISLTAMLFTFSHKEAFVFSGKTIRFRKFFKNVSILVFILGYLLLVFAASAGYIIRTLSGAGG